jgi:hypothetical protein
MDPDRTSRMLALYGVYSGISLIAWWVAYGIQAIPPVLVPLDVRAGHIVAEVALGVALVVGGVLTGRLSAIGRPVLIAALGGLVYAILNVIGDYFMLLPARTPMFMLLLIVSASAVATLVMAVRSKS